MISFLSSWAKSVGLAIVIVSILEMVLPNNKTKKYIKMVMGVYILFSIISPFFQNKINANNFDVENYVETSVASTNEVDQTSMDKRIKQLYIQELEKDITSKVQKEGYNVKKCQVDATITDNVENTKINKITLQVEKDGSKKETDNSSTESKVVSTIQKIKGVDVNTNEENKTDSKVSKSDIADLKKFLEKEYEVSEQCLAIN